MADGVMLMDEEIEAKLRAAFPECDRWEVRGERVVRGQMLLHNCWRYVYLGETRLLSEVFTSELLDDIIGGEATVLRILLAGPLAGTHIRRIYGAPR